MIIKNFFYQINFFYLYFDNKIKKNRPFSLKNLYKIIIIFRFQFKKKMYAIIYVQTLLLVKSFKYT